MLLWKILVPTHHNDGRKFSAQHHARFEARMTERFGGFTFTGETFGTWVHEGMTYGDTCRSYEVAVESVLRLSHVEEIVSIAARHYEQEAIYITCGMYAEVVKPNWRGIVGRCVLPDDAFEREAA